MILAKIENPNASQLFEILMGLEVQNYKNEQGGPSMVSIELNLLHKTEIITKTSSQITHLRP